MVGLQRALTVAAGILCCAILLGLLWRRRARLCYTWGTYLGLVAVSETLILVWPGVFWTWTFWTAKELTLAVLKLGIGLEIGVLAFHRFPGANRVASRLAALAVGATALAIVAAPGSNRSTLAELALEAHSRLSHGAALLLIAVGALVLWYRVPVHRLHRAILRGLATYLLVFSSITRLALSILAPRSWPLWQALTQLDGLAYVLLLTYWAWEAWRRTEEDEFVGSTELERRLAWRERL